MMVPTIDSLFVKLLCEAGLTKEQVWIVLIAMTQVCTSCWENIEPCYCAPGYDE